MWWPSRSLGYWLRTQAWSRPAGGEPDWPPLPATLSPRRGERCHEPLPEPGVDEDPGRDVADERDDERRNGAPPDGADGEGEPEREQRVPDGDGALEVERAVLHAALEMDERRAPPGDEQRHRERRDQRSGDRRAELGRDPAPPRDALRPGEPVGPALELEHERRGEQHADQPRHEREPGGEVRDGLEPRGERADRPAAGIRAVRAGRTPRCRRGRRRSPSRSRSGRAAPRAAR